MDESSEAPAVRGVIHAPQQVWTVYYLGLATAALTLFSAAPAILELFHFYREVETIIVPRWVHFVFLLACIQLAYTVYLVQLPDWSTVWVVAIFLLILATLYAMLWGVTLLGSSDNALIQFLQLETQLAMGRASGWCLIMLSLTGLLSYIVGRVGYRWGGLGARV